MNVPDKFVLSTETEEFFKKILPYLEEFTSSYVIPQVVPKENFTPSMTGLALCDIIRKKFRKNVENLFQVSNNAVVEYNDGENGGGDSGGDSGDNEEEKKTSTSSPSSQDDHVPAPVANVKKNKKVKVKVIKNATKQDTSSPSSRDDNPQVAIVKKNNNKKDNSITPLITAARAFANSLSEAFSQTYAEEDLQNLCTVLPVDFSAPSAPSAPKLSKEGFYLADLEKHREIEEQENFLDNAMKSYYQCLYNSYVAKQKQIDDLLKNPNIALEYFGINIQADDTRYKVCFTEINC